MNTAQRRTEILKLLQQEEKPVAARAMASQFGVSRQVIVQDMAVIRASTPGILSTTRGYVLQHDKDIACTREFKVRHGQEQAAEELNLIVDCGGGGEKYQHQPQGLWPCHCRNGYSFQTGCE